MFDPLKGSPPTVFSGMPAQRCFAPLDGAAYALLESFPSDGEIAVTAALIVYFSIDGSTRSVAERIARGVGREGVDAHLHDLRDGPAPSPRSFDLLGMGSPTYYFRVSAPIEKSIRALPDLERLPVFSFVTYGTDYGGSLDDIRRGLRRRGGREVGALAARGEDHYPGYLREGYLFSPGCPNADELQHAEEFGAAVASAIRAPAEGEIGMCEAVDGAALGPVFRAERLCVAPALRDRVYRRFFRADSERCTRCGLCVRRCPMSNITIAADEIPRWGRACIACATCALVCPHEAVRCPLDWPVFELLARYNIRHHVRDPDIDVAGAVLRRGRIEVSDEGGSP